MWEGGRFEKGYALLFNMPLVSWSYTAVSASQILLQQNRYIRIYFNFHISGISTRSNLIDSSVYSRQVMSKDTKHETSSYKVIRYLRLLYLSEIDIINLINNDLIWYSNSNLLTFRTLLLTNFTMTLKDGKISFLVTYM